VLRQLQDGLRAGQVLIDTTTGSPEDSEQLAAELQQRQVCYLDAPISGSSEQTRRGEAVAIVGGDRKAFDACQDIFHCIVRRATHLGGSGSGSRMKLVTNLVLGLNRAAVAEGLVFAKAMGLDPKQTLEVLLGSAAYSRQMETKGPKMVAGDFQPQARLSQHLKDVRIILKAATQAGQALPLSELHRQLLETAESLGHGDADNSAVIRAIEAASEDLPPDGPRR
jgi:3-hydroxyisobutyrate dehydrogenase-like beta-hydroxyacid dehydrogenase